MASTQSLPDPGTGDTVGVASERGSTAGTPRWVWVLGILIAFISLSLLVSMYVPEILGGGPPGGGPGGMNH